MPKDNSIKSILIIGSGPIVIGQACEFDYSGSQASRSLREEGIEVTLINSNPATIMTDKVVADNVYLKPLEPESIIEILEKHDIDAVLPTMGGQTGLNLCIKCEEMGIWDEYNVKTVGVDINAIEITENREAFRDLMEEIGVGMAPQKAAKSFLQGKEIAQEFGFPLCVRASYTLGGAGASIVHDPAEFDNLLERGLQLSPIHEVMIDKALLGWKEYELELLRDANDNVVIICSIENFDPMGVHTGDSITVLHSLEHPSWNRLFHIYDAIKRGIPFKTIVEKTKIDIWFLKQIEDLIKLEDRIEKHHLDSIPKDLLFEAKQKGYADRQVAHLLRCLESEVHAKREEFGISRVYKLVDTCAAEFEAQTPYYYSTFEYENESVVSDKKKVVVLGSGPNRIGQGIEFDYSCVHGVLAAKEAGYETVMINCNPETVSTDFDTADKLYFEPVFWEHIYDIIKHEKPEGVIVQLGGQTALKLAEKLERYGIKIFGTSYDALDLAEDRGRFSNVLKKMDIPYPKFGVVENAEQALQLSDDLGFPLLVRPSYVLGGQKMKIVINKEELEHHVVDILRDMPDNQILLDHFLGGAIEAEADAICDGENVYIIGVMQHIEPAGIHSGDSYAVLPPYNLGDLVMTQIEDITRKVAIELKTVGLMNIQFAIKDDKVYVIEANPRASRTVPFIAKAYDEPYVNYAAKVMLGDKKVKDFNFQPKKKGYAIKIPVFSYEKFPEVKKELGPEMKSTGEAIRFIDSLKDPYFMKIYSERNMHLSR